MTRPPEPSAYREGLVMRPDEQPDTQGSLEESDLADARDLHGVERDRSAEARDDVAGNRTMQADIRDVAAARRDELAEELLAQDYTSEQLLSLYLVSKRTASADRRMASAERRASTEDRLSAARDRHAAATNRQGSAADRCEASLDPLTGVYNRAAGFKELARDIDRARRDNQPFTLAFIDVDGLKATNDRNGHAAGDRALKRVGQALRAHLRAHDLIIRFGGDEFLCALASIDQTEINTRLALVSRTLEQRAEQVHITVGLATLEPDDSVDDLFRRADAAFYDTRKRR
jgi:diguanylate cyclase (GGDEF)-like protein